jgi:predicted  nucleic acid-binding Zn-ribbon protein
MPKKKEKWYVVSKLSKGELANENVKLNNQIAHLTGDLSFANESIESLKIDLINQQSKNKELRLQLKDQELNSLENKVYLLEKLVSLHETKTRDKSIYVDGSNGSVTTSSTSTII